MTGGLDLVHGVVGGVRHGNVHEVRLDEVAVVVTAGLSVELLAAGDLEGVVVQAGDGRAGERGDLAQGTADAAPDVEDLLARAHVELGREKVLVPDDGLAQSLPLVPVRVMERFAQPYS